ncbi:MAG: c-type cytochrome [Planctomycetaceae bacterium]|nr:c-type cytochrome [Planctomycetaceae bacterium]
MKVRKVSRWVRGASLFGVVGMLGLGWAEYSSHPLAAVGLVSATSAVRPLSESTDEPVAEWIWASAEQSRRIALRKTFALPDDVRQVKIAATCDNHFQLWLNSQEILASGEWEQIASCDATKNIRAGANVLAALATDEGGARAFLLRMDVIDKNGQRFSIVSDSSWRSRSLDGEQAPSVDWNAVGFDDQAWATSKVFGQVGAGDLPWSGQIDEATLAEAVGQAASPGEQTARVADNVTAVPGFVVQKLFDVPRNMGSWVALTTGRAGRLIASDQGGAGLFEILPADLQDPAAVTRVEKLPVSFSSAQGLLWKDNGLFAVRNGSGSGLYRLDDSDGDGQVDSAQLLKPLQGDGEHGPHAVLETPDQKSLVVIGGNHTAVPESLHASRLPQNWSEDLLLPRRWDANGHAAGILAPGGWIAQTDQLGKRWELISAGYRNQYDMAYNGDGELFTYDADMEWDLGSPWYRPTRVNHATSGSEMGWRSGTGKWPTYYEDSLPPVVDIGPGSPVGVTFGYGARFPGKYQRALYLLDWTYSTIYACHLTPEGASYSGQVEDFVFGQPLQVTDAVVGHDGALYFTAGGRGTRSALYRVVYVGEESTAKVDPRDVKNADLRQLRRRLEAFHQGGTADEKLIWDHLGHEDRFIRYAARVALEHRPVDSWRDSALAEPNPRAALTALMALARCGGADDLPSLIGALLKFEPKQFDSLGQLTWLRNFQLAFLRLGAPSESLRQQVVERLLPLYTVTGDSEFNRELLQLLVYLESPKAVELGLATMRHLATQPEPIPQWSRFLQRNAGYGGTVQAMLDNMPPVREFYYAFALRNAKVGWTVSARREYFSFFTRAAMHPGGASYPGFLSQSRGDALANVSSEELPLYDDLLAVPLGGQPYQATPPQGPGQVWTVDKALDVLGDKITSADFEAGRNLFHATNCAKCHRFAGEGGAIGPDLSTAGRKFSWRDLLEAIIEPSKAISDQYGSHQIATVDGQVLIGRVVKLGEQIHVYTTDVDRPAVVLSKDEIEEMVPASVSQMPTGTIDSLNADELKHLMAYLLSSGDRNAEVYRNP